LRDKAEARAEATENGKWKTENGKWKHFLHFPLSVIRFPLIYALASASEVARM
jgi:hypothetical protein